MFKRLLQILVFGMLSIPYAAYADISASSFNVDGAQVIVTQPQFETFNLLINGNANPQSVEPVVFRSFTLMGSGMTDSFSGVVIELAGNKVYDKGVVTTIVGKNSIDVTLNLSDAGEVQGLLRQIIPGITAVQMGQSNALSLTGVTNMIIGQFKIFITSPG